MVNSKYTEGIIGSLLRNPFWIPPSGQIARWNSYWSPATQKLVCPPKPFNLDFCLTFKTLGVLSKATAILFWGLSLFIMENLWGFYHTWYLSRTPRIYSCKFFLAGVNFYRFNAKNWQFSVYFAVITQKIGNFLCILS